MLLKDKISRKQEIEQKATKLFKEKGYAASSMRDLASMLGIEAASIYSHIKSKEEILQKICFTLANQFLNNLNNIYHKKLSAEETLRNAIIAHVKVITEDVSASAVFWNEYKHLSEPYITDFLKMKNEYENCFIEIIKKGVRRGEFRKIEEKFAAMTILSSLNGIHQWYNPKGRLTPGELGDQIAVMLIDGLKAGNKNSKLKT